MFNTFGAQAYGLHGFPPSSVVTALLRPDADDSISDWTDQAGGTANLYATIDETPASDADYIMSPTPPNTSLARFRLSDPTAGKTLATPVIVRYRFRKTTSDDQKLDVTLKQGTTAIATWRHTGGGLTTSFQTVAQTLSAPQLASISDFNSLYIEFRASPFFDGDVNTVLLMHMDEGFSDSSQAQRGTATAAGNAVISTADKKFGTASGYFDGAGDWLTFPDSPDWDFGSGDFTIDCWFNCTAAGGTSQSICGQRDSGGTATSTSFHIARSSATNQMVGTCVVGGVTVYTVTTTTTFTNTVNPGWHHLAFVRASNVLKLFIDGVQEGGDVAISGALTSSANLLGVGIRGESTSGPWTGYIDEFRISKGIARWTTNFAPPTAATLNTLLSAL